MRHRNLIPRRSPRGQTGQIIPLLALSAVALIAVAGMSLDIGRAFVDQRALQAAADTGSDAGARMLAQDFTACTINKQAVLPYTNAQIETAAQTSATAAAAAQGRATTISAVDYTTISGTVMQPIATSPSASTFCTSQNGWSSQAPEGVQVKVADAHSTFLLPIVNIGSGREGGQGTSLFTVVDSVGQGANNFAPYAIWYDCGLSNGNPAQQQISPGDIITFRSNSWNTNASCGQSGITSNDFKGYLHNPSSYPLTPGTTLSSGGNTIGQEPTAMLQADCAAGTPVIAPVVDGSSGSGTGLVLDVSGFVALKLLAPCSNYQAPASTDWTAQVVALAPSAAGLGYCTNSSCLTQPPSGYLPPTVVLYQ